MNLFGPTKTLRLGGKRYGFVIVDHYFRFTWVYCLVNKEETLKEFRIFHKKIENEKELKIKRIKSDHGGKFKNLNFMKSCVEHEIFHEFSSAKTPRQNSVVERKNIILLDISRKMLAENNLPKCFLVEVINMACCIMNRIMIDL